jgi:hypothetical protein
MGRLVVSSIGITRDLSLIEPDLYSLLTHTQSPSEAAIMDAFAVTCCLAMVHLMQADLPHAALQVAHVADACSSRVDAASKRTAAPSLLLVACNTTLALAAIGGGGGIREWLRPMRASCRDVMSLASTHHSSDGHHPSTSIAVACAHSVQGALQALQGSHAHAAASLDDALAHMRAATSRVDVALLTASLPDSSLHELLRVRELVHDSAVVTWNMCAVFSSGDSGQQQQQQQQCYDCALSECVKFTSAAGSDPGRPMMLIMCDAAAVRSLHR